VSSWQSSRFKSTQNCRHGHICVHEPTLLTISHPVCATGLDSRPASGLTLNLSSNNPFRNRAASPASNAPRSPFDPPPRPVSRNPFLDASPSNIPPPIASLDRMSSSADAAPRPKLTGNAAELFVRHFKLEYLVFLDLLHLCRRCTTAPSIPA
jgi:hypothetical protein